MSGTTRSILALVALVLISGPAIEALNPFTVENEITRNFLQIALGIAVAAEIKFSVFSELVRAVRNWRGVKIQLPNR
jgi:hypothetical protein